MTATSRKKTTVQTNTIDTVDAVMVRFRDNDVPELGDKTAAAYITAVAEACEKCGYIFLIHETDVSMLSTGHFQCTYSVEILFKNSRDRDPLGNFTVIGNPMTARRTALDMAIVDFAGVYREVEKAYLREVPKPQTGVTNGTILAGAEVEEPTPNPSQELQQALARSQPASLDESALVEQLTPDGLPILIDLFSVDGDVENIANEASEILRQAATTAPNIPSMRSLWTKNEENFAFIKDYAPDTFNALLQLFKDRDRVLKGTETVVNHPGKTKEEPLSKRRKPLALQKRGAKKAS